MKKKIIENFKIIYLQNDTYYIVCRLEESIPKGIIIYYPLVSFIYELFVKKPLPVFLNLFFLKEFKFLNIFFFAGPSGPLVPSNRINELDAIFGTKPGPNGTNAKHFTLSAFILKLEHKITFYTAADPCKKTCAITLKKPRKIFFFSHPPPKTQNSCQQWHTATKTG